MRGAPRDNDLVRAAPGFFEKSQDSRQPIKDRACRRAKNLGGGGRLGQPDDGTLEIFRPGGGPLRDPERQNRQVIVRRRRTGKDLLFASRSAEFALSPKAQVPRIARRAPYHSSVTADGVTKQSEGNR